ncbi:aldo/keto reductase [Micrococcales bacterium 31B]|nr:aldo/keto reductase [Micrococcales bacterium 31B]
MTSTVPIRRVGASGLAVSSVGLGCNNLGRPGTATQTLEGTQAVIDAALDHGITFFDVADCYGAEPGLSETLLGRALAGRRDRVVIGTKFGLPVGELNGPDFGARGSRRYIRRAVEGSLRRLGTDYIDLFQFHTPDPTTPIEETLDSLGSLIDAGLVRYIGHSNRSGWQIADAEAVGQRLRHRFISAQNEYSLLHRTAEQEILPAARHYGLGVFPYFPLFNGLLSGKYTATSAPSGSRLAEIKPALLESADWPRLEQLQGFADARGVTMLDIAFAWLLSRPEISSVIAGATRPEQVAQNAAAATAIELSPTDLAEIDAICPGPGRVSQF